jgi:carbamoyltransferase
MNVLGISCFYHDAAACLAQDGKIVAAAMEERFTRKKHDISFPINAVLYCLKSSGVDADKVDAVAFYEEPYLKFERVLYRHLQAWPHSKEAFVRSIGHWLTAKLPIRRTIKKSIRGFPINCQIYTVRHHISHAASAYYCSPFADAAILTIDGVGEWSTTACGIAENHQIKLFREIRFPHSLGLLYSALTAYLGFRVNNSEYKVMGLAGFGKPRYQEELKQLITLHEDGSYSLALDYFDFWRHEGAYSQKLVELLGPPRKKDEPVTERHMDIAASLQVAVEEAIYAMATALHAETKKGRICMAGGVLLNSLANGRFLDRTPFKDMYIPPAPGDDGGAVGAALYVTAQLNGKNRLDQNGYYHDGLEVQLGPSYAQEEIEFFCRFNGTQTKTYESDQELVEATAKIIAAGNVVGWFQGGMEWGPRALGHRSILADPRDPKMQDILNEKVKHRERFRPFAPSVCSDEAWRYFEVSKENPISAQYMLLVRPVREEYKMKLPAITHVDGTARLHTVDKRRNPLFYALLRAFETLSGFPVLVNTSFNVRGEPIVCTPNDALSCFLRTDIDYLVMGRCMIAKADNQHLVNALPSDPHYEEYDE